MSTFVEHKPCRWCTSSDAMAVYADGSVYCFSCGTSRGGSVDSFVAKRAFAETARGEEAESEEFFSLPAGFSRDFSKLFAISEGNFWRTTLTVQELYEFNYYSSPSSDVLARVFVGTRSCECGRVVGGGGNPSLNNYTGIEFKQINSPKAGNSKRPWVHNQSSSPHQRMDSFYKNPKSRFLGRKDEISGASSKMCGIQQSCALVEDSFSAIRVGRHVASYTLFGSAVSNNKLSWLIAGYKKVFVWLDSDKFNYAKQLAARIQLMGKEAIVIYTDDDPKYVDDGEIKFFISEK